MKKTKISIFLAILLLSLGLFGCDRDAPAEEVSQTIEYEKIDDLDDINYYEIRVDINTEDMTYRGEQDLTYLNKSEDDLDELYFHLYPNAFKSLEDAPILFDVSDEMHASDYDPGYIEIEKAMIAEENLDFELEKDSQILKIKLPKALKSGEKLDLYLEYRVKLPSTKDRFGYHDNGINFGNWYPIVSVYDEDGWHLDPYYKIGDPFFSELSDYEVEIRAPEGLEIAASGNLIDEYMEEGRRIYIFRAEDMRDFAFAASEKFVVATRDTGDTRIKLYSITDDDEIMDLALDYGEDSLAIFSEKFGDYPYDEYKIVNTEFPSGMEYPGLVLVSNDYFNEVLIDILEIVIVHETAHQWWYGIVGTDQIRESWIDEGLATYSEVIYMDEVYGDEAADFHYEQNIRSLYEQNSGFLREDKRVDKPLDEFESWTDYSILVYSRGVGFFKEISDSYGSETLEEILEEAYDRYKFKNMSQDEFIALCEEIIGGSVEDIVEKHLR